MKFRANRANFSGVLTEIDTRCRTESPYRLAVDYGELGLSLQPGKRQRRWNGKYTANPGMQGASLKGWRVGRRRPPPDRSCRLAKMVKKHYSTVSFSIVRYR